MFCLVASGYRLDEDLHCFSSWCYLSQWIKLEGARFCQERQKDRQKGTEGGREGGWGEGYLGTNNGTVCLGPVVSSSSQGESKQGLDDQTSGMLLKRLMN